MKVTAKLLLATSMMAYAATCSSSIVADVDYCKVDYVNQENGREGIYRGQCKNNLPDGSGEVSFHNGDKLTGMFKSGLLTGDGKFESAEGNTYKGSWLEGNRHGHGTFSWARGSHYVGEWIDNKRHGKGVFTWSNGNRFEGEFRNNKRYNGKYYTSTGRVYKCYLGQCK